MEREKKEMEKQLTIGLQEDVKGLRQLRHVHAPLGDFVPHGRQHHWEGHVVRVVAQLVVVAGGGSHLRTHILRVTSRRG